MSRAISISLLVALYVGVSLSPARADKGGVPAEVATLQQDVQTLQQQVRQLIENARNQNNVLTQLTVAVRSQSNSIDQLQQQNQALAAKLGCVSPTSTRTDLYFDGCNVHIVSGSGATNGAVNGLGNLIIGYNEDGASICPVCEPPAGHPGPRQIGGSHNLVVGPGHSYTSYGGLVAGFYNAITGAYASVSGGIANTASGPRSSVSGGNGNIASGSSASVSGGGNNTASNGGSSVSGGQANTASAGYSSVSGGIQNTASNSWSSVSGGGQNTASGDGSSVSGGGQNTASANVSSVSGGQNRTAPNIYDWAGGEYFSEQ